MIKFLCPNGHPLTAPENLVGRPGKCPKCNAPFVVPPADDEDEELSTGADSAIMPAMGSGKNLTGSGELFVFLCPNGHKLNGPPSLKGKPGQCPHCGARFIIPTDEDIDEAEQAALRQQYDASSAGVNFNDVMSPGEANDAYPAHGRPPLGAAGLGFIVARLWEQRTDGSELEVFLNEGEIIAPDFYSGRLSTSDYGVFAIQEGDGSYAITIIPWTSVRRVGLRRLGELSGELFQ